MSTFICFQAPVRWLALLLCLVGSMQAAVAQTSCSTSTTRTSSAQQRTTSEAQTQTCGYQNNNCFTARVFFHFVNRSDGTDGIDPNLIPEMMSILNAGFAPRGIYFSYAGQDVINDSQYYNGMFLGNDPFYNQLVQQNVQSNAINAYVLGTNCQFQGGQATGIIGSAFAVGGYDSNVNKPVALTAILSHEMGHCFGLFHTYEEGANGTELSGYACSTGDLVAQTPPETQDVSQSVNPNTCEFPHTMNPNGGFYHPAIQNIMDDVPTQCKISFVPEQGWRMKYFLLNSATLAGVYVTGFQVPSLVWQLTPQPDTHTAQFTIVNYVPPGNGVTYTITNKSGCAADDPTAQQFTVQNLSNSASTTTFTFNTNSSCGSTTKNVVAHYMNSAGQRQALTSQSSHSTTASPNPASEYLTVPEDATQAVLFNTFGQEVQRADNSHRLNVQGLPAGLYQLRMSQEGKATTQHIEVTH